MRQASMETDAESVKDAPATPPPGGREERPVKKRPPASLFAMGNAEAPAEVSVDPGVGFRFVKLFKHDFFAMTALYENAEAATAADRFAVLKVQRTYPFYGFPMCWLGRIVARREILIYQKLQGVRGIPRFLGRVGATGFLHEFIPGTDLHAGQKLTPSFFEDLSALFTEIHARHVAYIDANKRENILHGEDGRPWLIDFQISFFYDPCGWNPVKRWWLRRFFRADWYHYAKHKVRLLPSACSAADFENAKRPGKLHRVHRFFARPIIRIRRKMLAKYDLTKTR
jgi:hypothetical protein